jgi:hypothetical protein
MSDYDDDDNPAIRPTVRQTMTRWAFQAVVFMAVVVAAIGDFFTGYRRGPAP